MNCNLPIFGDNTEDSAVCVDSQSTVWGGEPKSNAGWWKVDVTKEATCEAQNRTINAMRPQCSYNSDTGSMDCLPSCPGMLPCTPRESCLGANQCATGYTYLQDQCSVFDF